MHKIICVLLLISPITFAASKPIEIKMLNGEQSITQILDLQHKMHMSATPKKISQQPQALCFKANINQFLPVADVAQAKPIYGCIFSDQVAMNSALLRAGLYVHTNIGIADDAKLFNSKLMSTVGGHDFNGAELYDYLRKSSIAEFSLPEHAEFKDIEKQFKQQIIEPIITANKDNFIFFAIINTKKFKQNLSHELLHAQYYNVPQIKEVLLKVWQNVVADDRQLIIKCLTNGGYDTGQQELLLREFYSYFLQYKAQAYLASLKVLAPMAELAPIYAPEIKKALQQVELQVLKIQN